MKRDRKVKDRGKKLLDLYVGWRSLKAMGGLGVVVALGYGGYRLYQRWRRDA